MSAEEATGQTSESVMMDLLKVPNDQRPQEDRSDGEQEQSAGEQPESGQPESEAGATKTADANEGSDQTTGGTDAGSDGASATDGNAGQAGQDDGATGKDGQAAVPEDTGADAADAAAADAETEQAGDAVGDQAVEALTDEDLTPPDGLKENARDRFQKMATGYRQSQERNTDLEQQLAQSTDQLEDIRSTFEDYSSEQIGGALQMLQNGFTPEEMQGMSEFMTAVRTGNTSAAMRMLDSARTNIAVTHGETIPGVMVHHRHPDLMQMVESLDVSEEVAERLAVQREQAARTQQLTPAIAPQQPTLGQQPAPGQLALGQQPGQPVNDTTTQLQNAGVQAVAALEENWKAHDPDYAAKEKWLAPQIERISQSFSPDQWAPQIKALYESADVLLSAAGATRKAPAATPRPLSSANGTSAPGEAKTSQEAINRVLDLSG